MKKILKIVLAMGLICCATACKNKQQPAIDCCETAYEEAKIKHWEPAFRAIKQVKTFFQKDITPQNCDPELMKKYGEAIALLSEAKVSGRIPDTLHWDWNMVYDFQMESAQKGSAVAQYNIGWYYCQKEKFTEAVKWWHKAAEQEYAPALYRLGVMCEAGLGVYKALEWYRKAAEQGYAPAQAKLGLMYEEGKGVSQFEALEWWHKAAEQEYAPALYKLGVMYENGDWKTQNYTEAMNWYRKAAEQGYEPAQFNLGVMYLSRDEKEAVKWLCKAAWQGNARASFFLRAIEASKIKSPTYPLNDDNKETNYLNSIWE